MKIRTDECAILFAGVVFFMGGLLLGQLFHPLTSWFHIKTLEESENHEAFQYPTLSINLTSFKGNFSASVLLPAVMQDGTGVYATLVVYAKQGSGKIFVRMDDMLVNDDTQNSIRKAALVASKLAGVNLSTVDLIYELNAPATELEGSSAGAAIAVATYAALTNSTIRPDVMMTGSINHDGTIGLASKVVEKAEVADKLNMTYFLVPPGTKQMYDYSRESFCYEWQKEIEFCDEEYVPHKTDFWNMSVNVVEVHTLKEALHYFIED